MAKTQISPNYLTLANGMCIPQIGMGTFKLLGEECFNLIFESIKLGYRHFDTASMYNNESEIGIAIKKAIDEGLIKREDLFITTKVWNTDQGYENTLLAFDRSLKKLNLDYIDLYLIHWPKPTNLETWKALENLYKDKKVRAIGVCNFKEHHLSELLPHCEIKPVVNQVELHPQFPQYALQSYCEENQILMEAWAPLIRGNALQNPLLIQLSKKYQKTAAQIIFRWHVQQNIIIIPKTSKLERAKENLQIFDFELSDADLTEMKSLEGTRQWYDPDNIDF